LYYLIYQITNNINGKIYVGKHQTTDKNDGYMGSGKLIRRAMNKYGSINFSKTILYECDSLEAMNRKEAEIVNEAFVQRPDTYNMKVGGDGGFDYINTVLTHEDRQKIGTMGSDVFKEKLKDKEYYAKWHDKFIENSFTEEVRQKRVATFKKNYVKENSFWYGRKHTEETKQKIGNATSIAQAGNKNSQYGTCLINKPELHQTKRIHIDELQEWLDKGWIKGAVYDWEKYEAKQEELKQNALLNEQKQKETIEYYTKLYEIYSNVGFEELVKETGYKHSQPNLVKQLFKYVKEFVPQNGKKRGKK
jgi:hypothetical protein